MERKEVKEGEEAEEVEEIKETGGGCAFSASSSSSASFPSSPSSPSTYMGARASKLLSLEEAAALICDGSTVAVGGLSYFGAPMALVRALVRRGTRGLTVVTAAVSGIQVDLLVAGGCVRRILAPYMALEELGLAPNFRRAVERGELEVVEIGEAFLAFGLKAAAAGAPFFALPLEITASDCPSANVLYRKIRDPYTGEQAACVPAIRPDWTLLHAQRADEYGNLLYAGPSYMDSLLARASRRVLATCDHLLEHAEVRGTSGAATIPSCWVRGVVQQPGAARPTASFGFYDVDRKELKRYIAASKSEGTRASYLAEFSAPAGGEATYQRALSQAPPPHSRPSAEAGDLATPPATAEIIAGVIAHSVRDGIFTGVGTGCHEVLAGLRLAQLTHAPNLSFTLGGSGALNPQFENLPYCLNSEEGLDSCEAALRLEEVMDLELAGAFDVMFASGMQIDRYGNLNLVCVGPRDAPKFRGPGTVGLEFAACVPEIVAFFRAHTPKIFVERVDFISAIGYGEGPGSRARWGLDDSRGPKLVVTNLAVMDFCPETLRMRLRSVHPGVPVDEVRQATGFELLVPARVPETPVPTPEELTLLRTKIDRGGLLRTLIPA